MLAARKTRHAEAHTTQGPAWDATIQACLLWQMHPGAHMSAVQRPPTPTCEISPLLPTPVKITTPVHVRHACGGTQQHGVSLHGAEAAAGAQLDGSAPQT